jgi:hypothetical protein
MQKLLLINLLFSVRYIFYRPVEKREKEDAKNFYSLTSFSLCDAFFIAQRKKIERGMLKIITH